MERIERRNFGHSGLTLPVLGVGCWAYGGGDYWGKQEQKDVNDVVAMALDVGANYFDTAEGYNEGRSEEALGVALKTRRSEALIGTKVPPIFAEPKLLRQHCEASLKRLQSDTIDIYMIHWPIEEEKAAAAFATLDALKQEGKIRAIGLSNYGVQQLTHALTVEKAIDINQLCFNPLARAIEQDLMGLCASNQIGILVYSPLQQGLLTGKYRTLEEMPAVRTRTRQFRGDRVGSRHGENGAEQQVLAVITGLRQISEELQVPMAEITLAWILAHPQITCVLPGSRTMAQLKENLAGASLTLSQDVVERINCLTQPLFDILGTSPDYYENSQHGRTW